MDNVSEARITGTLAGSARRSTMYSLAIIAFANLAGCTSPPRDFAPRALPRVALRTEAVGCWRLGKDRDEITTLIKGTSSIQLRSAAAHVDSATVTPTATNRAVHRLDTLGRPFFRDWEGLSFQDSWMADSLSDTVRITLHNGLYGVTWVLALPAAGTDTIRGWSKWHDDVYPPTKYPVKPIELVREPCSE